MKSELKIDLCIKLLLVGDSGVGKTNILTRFSKNEFNHNTKSTIGVEFGTKILNIKDHNIKLQIWDTAGQERYKSITVAYYKGSKGAIIVYDITRKESFNNILTWLNDIKNNADKDIVIILVGNKCDLIDREVSIEEGRKFAEMYGIYALIFRYWIYRNISYEFNEY